MKQQQLIKAFKQGFYAGALMALTVYFFARILFYEFTFTAWEELSNFCVIVVAGGLMVSVTLILFLLLENAVAYLSTGMRSVNNRMEITPIEDIQAAA